MCILCQQTSPKRWIGNMQMTSNCEVANSAHQIQMATIRHWTKTPPWKFSAYATGCDWKAVCRVDARRFCWEMWAKCGDIEYPV